MNKRYPFVIWLFTLLIGSAILAGLIEAGSVVGYFQFFTVSVVTSALLSLPTLLITWLTFEWVWYLTLPALVVKAAVATVAIAGMLFTFLYEMGSFSFRITIPYSMAVLTATALYPLIHRHQIS
jgi:hypothetical protein